MLTISEAARLVERDLKDLFGVRVTSIVAYGATDGQALTSTLAILDRLTADDLRACATRVAAWHDAGAPTPLLLGQDEFARSLDAFPFEFGAILARHVVVSGADPFGAIQVDPADLRHACEVQARGHLLHLRQGYVETAGRGDAVADLVTRSAGSLAALVTSVARLHGDTASTLAAAAACVEQASGVPTGSLAEVAACASGLPLPSARARTLFPGYLQAVETLTNYIDRWTVSVK